MKTNRKPIIGVMGPGSPGDTLLLKHAEKLGRFIAENNWVLLTGGRNTGVMDAASKGAFEAGRYCDWCVARRFS
jgi:predicted Rossmann-fold nucleotide-binding protein